MVQLKELQRRIRLLKNGAVDDSTYAAWLDEFVNNSISALDYRRALLIDSRFEFPDDQPQQEYLQERLIDGHWEVSCAALGANPMMPIWLETELPGLYYYLFREAHEWGDWIINEFLMTADDVKIARLIDLIEKHTGFSMEETYREFSPGENLRGNIESCFEIVEETEVIRQSSDDRVIDTDRIDNVSEFFTNNLLQFIREKSSGMTTRFATSTRLFYAIEKEFGMKSSPKMMSMIIGESSS